MNKNKIKAMIAASSDVAASREIRSIETAWVEVGAEKVPHETVRIEFFETTSDSRRLCSLAYNAALYAAKNCKTMDEVAKLIEMK